MKKIIMIALILSALMIGGIIIMNEESYAFCGSKCKHPVYTKDDYVLLTIEKEVTTPYPRVNFSFPDDTWTVDNTRVIEARRTYYNKLSNGSFDRNRTNVIPRTVIIGETLSEYDNLVINPDGYNSLSEEADITISSYINGYQSGDKIIYEVLLMKINS